MNMDKFSFVSVIFFIISGAVSLTLIGVVAWFMAYILRLLHMLPG